MTVVGLAPLPALLLVVLATIATAGCGANIELGGDTIRRIERDAVSAVGVDRVEVDTGNGRVDVVASRSASAGEIEVDVIMHESDEGDADYTVEVDDGVVSIDGECDSGWFRQCSVGFVVTVPDGVAVDIDTDNGAIVLERLAGEIDAHTNNGAVTGDDLVSDDVEVRTDNGRIELLFDHAPATVDAHTNNGAIDVLVPDDGTDYDVRADSDNGAVDIEVPHADGSAHRITAESDNGRIDIAVRR